MTRTLKSFRLHEQDKVEAWAKAMYVTHWHDLYDRVLHDEALVLSLSEKSRELWQFEQEKATVTNGGHLYLKPEQRERAGKLLALGAATEFGQVLSQSPVFYSAALRWLISEHSRPPRVV
jgi:hypothetical protein